MSHVVLMFSELAKKQIHTRQEGRYVGSSEGSQISDPKSEEWGYGAHGRYILSLLNSSKCLTDSFLQESHFTSIKKHEELDKYQLWIKRSLFLENLAIFKMFQYFD